MCEPPTLDTDVIPKEVDNSNLVLVKDLGCNLEKGDTISMVGNLGNPSHHVQTCNVTIHNPK